MNDAQALAVYRNYRMNNHTRQIIMLVCESIYFFAEIPEYWLNWYDYWGHNIAFIMDKLLYNSVFP